MHESAIPDIEQALGHEPFLRNLARSLVRGDDQVDDQEGEQHDEAHLERGLQLAQHEQDSAPTRHRLHGLRRGPVGRRSRNRQSGPSRIAGAIDSDPRFAGADAEA